MSKFLHSRVGTALDDEILNQNVLTIAHLRSLIPGDFHLEYWGEDFLLLHEKGIFLLKQCHRNGVIYGEISQQQWIDRNYLGEETLFPNPLTENGGSIEQINRALKLSTEDYHSCIIFDTQCELRQVPQQEENVTVLRVDQLEEFFARFPQRELRYTHTQLDALRDIYLLVTGRG